MKKMNGAFIMFVFLIGFLSVIYIWKAENEKTELEISLSQQTEKVESLSKQLADAKIDQKEQLFGEVRGTETTTTGVITGTISGESLSDSTIVCATDQGSKQDYCSDDLIKTANSIEFKLEIPTGKYAIYATTPPSATKSYYSDIQDCFDSDNCEDKKIKRLIDLVENDVQSDIDITL